MKIKKPLEKGEKTLTLEEADEFQDGHEAIRGEIVFLEKSFSSWLRLSLGTLGISRLSLIGENSLQQSAVFVKNPTSPTLFTNVQLFQAWR